MGENKGIHTKRDFTGKSLLPNFRYIPVPAVLLLLFSYWHGVACWICNSHNFHGSCKCSLRLWRLCMASVFLFRTWWLCPMTCKLPLSSCYHTAHFVRYNFSFLLLLFQILQCFFFGKESAWADVSFCKIYETVCSVIFVSQNGNVYDVFWSDDLVYLHNVLLSVPCFSHHSKMTIESDFWAYKSSFFR